MFRYIEDAGEDWMMKEEARVMVYIQSGEKKFRQKDAELLRAIEKHGSINKATEKLGRSYSHQQKRIDELEMAFGKLIERQRGGRHGGGSKLTKRARGLIKTLENKLADLSATAGTEITQIKGKVKSIDSDLVDVETAIGSLKVTREGWMQEDQETRILIRADTITLQELGEKTLSSARNHVEGAVERVKHHEDKAEVTVYLQKNNETLKATLTRDSVNKLDIKPGKKLYATFKATATKAIPIKQID
ncbi:MAG: LysR family transcriptional regulator [Methanonatronarchaeia archaeon]|nr:MAG: LysR family transcriptional regulator [Methanonatronarchaeia archaeon]